MKNTDLENKNTEELLLSNKSLDELIRVKIQQEINLLEQNKISTEKTIIYDIKKVPKNLIFSKISYFKVFNKQNKTESFINGIQADGLLGLQDSIRQKILEGECDVFANDDIFVRFDRTEIN